MLIWIAALHCEAKPVIDFYRLKKSPAHRGFDLYQNDDMCLVVSGIGKTSAAAATAWVAALQSTCASTAWINLGIAGAASHEIGSAFWVSKITCKSTGQNYYPVPTFSIDFNISACTTLDQASNEYQPSTLYEMEASGFFATATRFSSAELIHCLKFVSDNQHQQSRFEKAAISTLINQHMETIDKFAKNLQLLNQQCMNLKIDNTVWQSILEQARFSMTQQAQLKTVLGYLLSQGFDAEALCQQVSQRTSSREILKQLNQIRLDQSRNL
ncbi:MAG: hypothetical protein OEY09_00405 [Gammaproteobacteria bacterium]|nr:hypothetical protein [Gammaproteobacteria bacterium]